MKTAASRIVRLHHKNIATTATNHAPQSSPASILFCQLDRSHVLLENAVIHRIGDSAYGTREYALVPADIPLELAVKDSKLKLASHSRHQEYSLWSYKSLPNPLEAWKKHVVD